MQIFKAYISGFRRSVKAWKGILIIWFFSLIMASIVALPMKSAMKAILGKSMVTEKLMGGLDADTITDLGMNFRTLTHFFSSGLILLMLIGILVNAFLTGGLFESLKSSENSISGTEFFRASARNFWSFLGITLILSLILGFISILVIGLPAIVATQFESGSEKIPYIVMLIAGIVFMIMATILLLVADYARAWKVTQEKASCFNAIGFGFGRTFETFFSSFLMMFMTLVVLILFSLLVIVILGPWRPVTGRSVFLMFLVSQVLFFVKVLIKTWRYGSVTSLMELNNSAENRAGENL